MNHIRNLIKVANKIANNITALPENFNEKISNAYKEIYLALDEMQNDNEVQNNLKILWKYTKYNDGQIQNSLNDISKILDELVSHISKYFPQVKIPNTKEARRVLSNHITEKLNYQAKENEAQEAFANSKEGKGHAKLRQNCFDLLQKMMNSKGTIKPTNPHVIQAFNYLKANQKYFNNNEVTLYKTIFDYMSNM